MEQNKEYFSVKLETMAPVTLTYKVYAESPEQAIEMAVKLRGQQQAAPAQIAWGRLKNLKATAYTAGSSIIRLAKTLV